MKSKAKELFVSLVITIMLVGVVVLAFRSMSDLDDKWRRAEISLGNSNVKNDQQKSKIKNLKGELDYCKSLARWGRPMFIHCEEGNILTNSGYEAMKIYGTAPLSCLDKTHIPWVKAAKNESGTPMVEFVCNPKM